MVEDMNVSPADDDDAVVAAEGVSSESALRDNISRKGKNAYYYAHAHKATGPEWDGKIEPRLLGTSSSNLSSSSDVVGGASYGNKAALMAKSNITNYAFVNEDARVKVYVELPGVGNCLDENILLDFTERSMCLTVKNYVPPPSAKAKVDVSDELVVDTTAVPDDSEVIGEVQRGGGGEDRCLSFGKLYAEIEKATYRKKADRVIITLTKKDKTAWSAVIA